MTKVILDTREASSNKRLKNKLRRMKNITSYDEEELYVGDILVGDYIIERKSTTDLLTKNKDGSLHIIDQLDRLEEMREKGLQPVILIEGKFEKIWGHATFKKQRILQARVNGLINSILFVRKIPVMKTDCCNETGFWIKNLIKRVNKPNEKSLRTLRTTPSRKMSLREEQAYLLQGHKGVGAVKSGKLLEEFKSPAGVYTELIYMQDGVDKVGETIGNKYARHMKEVILYEEEK